MGNRNTSTRRRRPIARLFGIQPIELDLTVEEIMADLDPGWRAWREQPAEDEDGESQAA